MKKILFILLILSKIMIGQEYQVISKIPKYINYERIINNYLKAIGGEEELNKINTIQKKFQVEILDVPNLNMKGEVLYKQPNLYSSVLEMSELGQIQSTKYNGEICVIERIHNNQKTIKNIEGKLLKEKIKDFYPFPILEAKKNEFKVIAILKNETTKLYKLYLDDKANKDSLFFFFDAKTHYLTMKQEIGLKTIKTAEYVDYRKINNVWFPFVEITKIEIDGKIAQESENKITEILINQEIPLTKFE